MWENLAQFQIAPLQEWRPGATKDSCVLQESFSQAAQTYRASLYLLAAALNALHALLGLAALALLLGGREPLEVATTLRRDIGGLLRVFLKFSDERISSKSGQTFFCAALSFFHCGPSVFTFSGGVLVRS